MTLNPSYRIRLVLGSFLSFKFSHGSPLTAAPSVPRDTNRLFRVLMFAENCAQAAFMSESGGMSQFLYVHGPKLSMARHGLLNTTIDFPLEDNYITFTYFIVSGTVGKVVCIS